MSLVVDPMIEEVNLTTARNLSPYFDRAVRKEHPTLIRRGRNERGLLISREVALYALSEYEFHVDVIPEEAGEFTLWLNELEIGASGGDLKEARNNLLSEARSYVRDYLENAEFYRRFPDKAKQYRHVLRLSLAITDAEMIAMLFGSGDRDDAAA